MSLARTVTRTTARAAAVVAAAVLVAGAARPAAAQERVLFTWQGRVDREASLKMQGSRVTAPMGWLGGSSDGALRVGSPLPQSDGVVRLRVERGRGAVDVLEQPSSRNDFTAVVRLRDDQPGADEYRVTAYWQPAYGDVARGRDGYGWGNDGRDGRYDRDGGTTARYDRDDRRRDRDERRRERDERRRDRDERRGGWGNGRGDGGYGGGSAGALRWSGRVDAVEEIRIRGRRADSYTVSGAGASDVRSRVDGALRGDTFVRVRRADGRGQVQVVQQPSAANDYTAVLRVVDRQPGSGRYDIEATW
jgi:hypothetical protein